MSCIAWVLHAQLDTWGGLLQVEGSKRHTLAANLVWDAHCTSGHGPTTLPEASEVALSLISTSSTPDATNGTLRPLVDIQETVTNPNRETWQVSVDNLLHALKAESDQKGDAGKSVERNQPTEDAIQVCMWQIGL